jgi:hypothetical protein
MFSGVLNMSIFNKVTKTFQWGQHTVKMETGEVARQAGGAVLLDMEGTVVLATVVGSKIAKAVSRPASADASSFEGTASSR